MKTATYSIRMSSYFDYFCKKIESEEARNTDRITGTCYAMCPEDEIKLREVENLVHILEVWGSERKLVKSYARSAADSNLAIPHLLRPFYVLTKTVHYLLLDVIRRVDAPQSVLYDFVNDRLRAVRQDMTIQRLPPEECVCLLEPMIRFYVYFSYELSNVPLKDYDPVLNKKYLLECMKWYLSCCDNIVQTQEKVDQLSGFLSNLDLDRNAKYSLVNDRVMMESLYILCNLDDFNPLYRYVSLPKGFKSQAKLQKAYDIAIANIQCNYIKVCRLLDKLCPLAYCALFTYLPALQRRALQVMSYAYNNKRLTMPTDVLAQWLHFPTARDAAAACAHYGLNVEGAAVRFDKTEFKADAVLELLKTQDVKKKFNLSIIDIFTYTTCK